MIRFGQFEVNTDTRELFLNGENIPIQNKSLELLLYLIEHNDRAVSKDELLERLWDGRVVSESVLSHASTKLRTALNDNFGKGDIIRTVYGFGLQFVASVTDDAKQAADNNLGIDTVVAAVWYKRRALYFVFAILMSLLVLYFTNVLRPDSRDENGLGQPSSSAKIGFVAADSQLGQDQWLVHGLTLYLNQVLAYSANTLPLPLAQSRRDFEDATRLYGIGNVVSTRQQEGKLLMSFKNGSAENSDLEVPLKNLPQAIKFVISWTCSEIVESSQDCESDMNRLTGDNAYGIESYLRGEAALMHSSPKEAIGFFTVALQQDKNFVLARLSLAQAYLALSEYQKAISQAQTAIQLSGNILIQHQAHILIGKAYFRRSEFALAKQALNKVIESTEPQLSLKAVALLEMARVTRDADELEKAFEMASRSKDILLQLDLPLLTARAYEAMGTIKLTSGELKLSQQYLTESLRIFEQLEYNAGIEKVLSPLGLVMQSQGLLAASLAYGQQRQQIAEKLGDPINIAGTHLHLANLLLEMGKIDAALEHANKMWDIVIEQDEPAAILLAYYIAGEIASATGKHRLALDKFEQALAIATDLEIHWRQVQILCTMGGFAVDGGFLDEAQGYLDRCAKLASETENQLFQVVAKLYASQLYQKQGQHAKSKSVLDQALRLSERMENDHLLYEIYLEYFEHFITSDVDQAETYLEKVPAGYRDDFVYLLSRAQIELRRKQYAAALQLALEAKQKARGNWSEENKLLLDKIKLAVKQ